jgi:hypothetical protein
MASLMPSLPTWMLEPPHDGQPTLIIQAWTSECGACGHGRGGWASSPALKGKPILTPESTVCPECGVHFTESLNVYTGERKPIEQAA